MAKGRTAIAGATSASYTTTPATSTSDNGAQFKVVVTNSAGSATSNAATLTVTSTVSSTDVLTYHNDLARTGQNLTETTLTLSNVAAATFGKIGFFSVDGLVDAEPLYASNVAVPSKGSHNLLLVATEHNSVYGFDADSGSTLWKTSMLKTGEATSDNRGCGQVTPEIGVTSTPVIDRTRGPNGAVYVVAMSKDGSGNYHQRIHALDLALGTELFGGPVDIQATLSGDGRRQQWYGCDFRTRPVQRACCPASAEWDCVYELGVALRLPPIHGLDYRLQRRNSGPGNGFEHYAEWQRRGHLDGRRRTGGGQLRQHLFS